MRSVALTALTLTSAFVFPIRAEETDGAGHDLFTSQVRPILARHCFKCHGPDDKARKARLCLDVHDESVKPAASGAIAIVPGKPDESERMPPAATKNPLSESDEQVLKRWIAGGAEYKTHFQGVSRESFLYRCRESARLSVPTTRSSARS
jgi:Planctomycete cytochrome C